jgi:hypothetical protein
MKIVEDEGVDIESPVRYSIEASFWDMELLSMGLHNLIEKCQTNTREFREGIKKREAEGEVFDDGPDLADQLFEPTEVNTQKLLDSLIEQLGYDPANG